MGKKSGPKPPPAPDPNQLIGQQQQANTQNISDLIAANRVNQVTPYGSITYSGGYGPNNAFGQTQTVTMDPASQATLQNQQGLAQLLSGQAKTMAEGLPTGGLDLSALPGRVDALNTNELPMLPGADGFGAERGRVEQAYFNRAKGLLDPVFQDQRTRTDQTLADRGFDLERSQGAIREKNRLDTTQNEAYNRAAQDAVQFGGAEQSRLFELAQAARNQGLTEQLANADLAGVAREGGLAEILMQRGLPYEDLAKLQGLTPNLPTLQPGGVPQVNSSPVDAIGAILGSNQIASNNYQTQMQNRGSFLGGLTGLLGGLGSALITKSDRRLKTDITPYGRLANGLTLYKWRWNEKAEAMGLKGHSSGVMADEALRVIPEAVSKGEDGYYRVDYRLILEGERMAA